MRRILSLKSVLQPNLQFNPGFQACWAGLRVVVGVVMVHNGLDKLSNIESFAHADVKSGRRIQ